MINRRLLVILFACAGIAAFAAAGYCQSRDPAVSIAVSEDDEVVQPLGEPILFYVGLADPDLINSATRNRTKREFMEKFSKSETFKKMPEAERERIEAMYKEEPHIPVVAGDAARPLAKEITFSVTDSKGKVVSWKVRPLAASADESGGFALDGTRSAGLFFGSDARTISKQPEGDYIVRASCGRSVSDPIKVTIKKLALDKQGESQIGREGRYYVLDKDFAKARPYAEELIRRDNRSVDGWCLMGEVLEGLGDTGEAVEAYNKAYQYTYEDLQKLYDGLKPEERKRFSYDPPVYIMRKLDELGRHLPGPPKEEKDKEPQ